MHSLDCLRPIKFGVARGRVTLCPVTDTLRPFRLNSTTQQTNKRPPFPNPARFPVLACVAVPATAQPSPVVVKVDPTQGHTLRGARDVVRAHLAARSGRTIVVELEVL